MLLNNGAKANINDNFGSTPLIQAGEMGNNEFFVKYAERLFATIKIFPLNCKYLRQNKIFYQWISYLGHDKVVQLLLSNNANINTQNIWDGAAINYASKNGTYFFKQKYK